MPFLRFINTFGIENRKRQHLPTGIIFQSNSPSLSNPLEVLMDFAISSPTTVAA